MGLVREMEGMRPIAQRQELCFKKYFPVWEFEFVFAVRTGMAWTMCCNIGFELWQGQASIFGRIAPLEMLCGARWDLTPTFSSC